MRPQYGPSCSPLAGWPRHAAAVLSAVRRGCVLKNSLNQRSVVSSPEMRVMLGGSVLWSGARISTRLSAVRLATWRAVRGRYHRLSMTDRSNRSIRLFVCQPYLRFDPLFEPHLIASPFTRTLREAGAIRTSFFRTKWPKIVIAYALPVRRSRTSSALLLVGDPAPAGRMGPKLGGLSKTSAQRCGRIALAGIVELSGYSTMGPTRYQPVRPSDSSLTPSVYNPRPTGETE
jgi:hypothetical protein